MPRFSSRKHPASAIRVVLPVSGLPVTLASPTGVEDLLLADQRGDPSLLALQLVERLAVAETKMDWAGLCFTDIDTLIMRLRQTVLGDSVSSSLTCTTPGCAARVEISFRVDAYLAHHAPHHGELKRRGWKVMPGADGFYHLCGDTQATFRLPLLRDQIAVAGLADPAAALAARCIVPVALPDRTLARVQTAMAAYAPPLSGQLRGTCPDCDTVIEAQFEARAYCLQELSFRAKFIYDDIAALAERYHWSERAILALPHARRLQYAERARPRAA